MKKRKRKPAKINRAIYIDADLDARMKKASDVNWSAIASVAFARELHHHNRRKNMGSVVERLKASKNEATTGEHDAGVADGHEWARQHAEYLELRRLSRFMDEFLGHELDRWFETGANNAYTAAEHLAFMICGVNSDRSVAASFWERAVGDESAHKLESDDYLRGFADAAVEVWNEVSDQL